MTRKQPIPTRVQVSRQPISSIPIWSSGGHIVPARYEPLITTEVAIPRRRSNQWVMFATSGTMIADMPRKPTRRPKASTICHSAVAWPARISPEAIAMLPARTGHMLPIRSDHQPMMIPPKPNPVKSTA